LKKEFYASPKNSGKRVRIKGRLESLQETIFEKGECGHRIKWDIEDEEMFQKLKNPTSSTTDPHQLADLIKEELRAMLEGRKKFRAGDRVGDI
jgi:hypothetical protein